MISVLAFLVGVIMGIPLTLLRVYGGRACRIVVEAYEKLLRGIPVLILMLLFYFGLGCHIPLFSNPFVTATLTLGMRSGAYQSQIYRGAVRGVGENQMKAARSLGLSKLKAFQYVVLPQMFIVATPGLGTEYALLIKDSAYAFIIGVGEILKQAKIIRQATQSIIFPYVTAALIYVALTFPVATYLDRWGSRKKKELGL